MDQGWTTGLVTQDVSHLEELCCPDTEQTRAVSQRGLSMPWWSTRITSGSTEELLTWGQQEFQDRVRQGVAELQMGFPVVRAGADFEPFRTLCCS